MRPLDIAAFAVSLTLLACGGRSTPAAPTSLPLDVVPSTTALNLVPGNYALTVTMAPRGEPTCDNGICIAVSLCGGLSGPPSVSALTAAVHLDRSADAITVRSEDMSATFRMDLLIVANTLSGTASGQFRDPMLQLSLAIGTGHVGQSAAQATGTVLATSVVGKIDGSVGIGGYSCSNNGHTWTLVPR
jgi:hypothetical protein